jgi:PAS domain S-box-containing protein
MPAEPSSFDALLVTRQSVRAAGGDIDVIFRAVVEKCLAILPRADGAIIEMKEADDLVYRAASGKAAKHIGRRLKLKRTFAGRSMGAVRPMMCSDIEDDREVDHRPYRDTGMRALISVPLIQRSDAVGALKLYSARPGAFLSRDLTIAQLVASQIMSGLSIVGEQGSAGPLPDSEERFEAIVDTLPMLVWTMTSTGAPTYCNTKVLDFYGGKQEPILWRNLLPLVDQQYRKLVVSEWVKARRDGKERIFECRLRSPIGTTCWMMLALAPLPDEKGNIREWLGTGVNIGRYKEVEAELRDLVSAKELLFHEINHRVKNSLQIVTGLLALQANQVAHPEARTRLLDARAQISTIAQIHQAIYASNSQEQIEIVEFLRILAVSLAGQGHEAPARITFEGLSSLQLTTDHGIPAALIAGELITNAFKHARIGSRPIEIVVSVTLNDTEIWIDVADSGPGLPAGFVPEHSDGLGMDIIFGLAQQAGGRIEIIRLLQGANFRLILPKE